MEGEDYISGLYCAEEGEIQLEERDIPTEGL